MNATEEKLTISTEPLTEIKKIVCCSTLHGLKLSTKKEES